MTSAPATAIPFVKMEPMMESNLGIRAERLRPGHGERHPSELETFTCSIDEISSKVNELEQKVVEVEQFYTTAGNGESNMACGPKLKDKVNEKRLVLIKRPYLAPSQVAAEKRMQELMHKFAKEFQQLTEHKWAWPFLEPVDVGGLGLHDYYKVIEKPMDFGTIKRKMEAKDGTGYKNVRGIYADVRLVFKNAMEYNDERDDVYVMAKSLLEKIQEKWLLLLPQVAEEEKRIEKEEAATQFDIKLAEEATYADMARDLSSELYEVDMHLEKLREMVVENCRKMTISEKKKLGTALAQLNPEDLSRALEIVAENNPSFQATGQEVELDMDVQTEMTLWRLKGFVQDTLRVMSNKSGSADDHNNDKNKKTTGTSAANATLATTTNRITSKRRRETCDAGTKAPAKRTRKIPNSRPTGAG